MFTGIITDVGRITAVDELEVGRRLTLATAFDTETIAIGASIACSGPCLTVVEKGPGSFAVDVSGETMDRTTVGEWTVGTRVNLERALRAADELGGHIVLGHVDGIGTVERIAPDGDNRRVSIRVPDGLARYIASKGSVTVDGISLTVNEVEGTLFGVNIIPHTWDHTALADRTEGSRVNLEIDVIARYVARLLQQE